MISKILDFLGLPIVRFGGAAAAVAWALTAWNMSQTRAEKRGETKIIAKVEKANAASKQMGERGASNRGVPVPGSVRDPRYRKD